MPRPAGNDLRVCDGTAIAEHPCAGANCASVPARAYSAVPIRGFSLIGRICAKNRLTRRQAAERRPSTSRVNPIVTARPQLPERAPRAKNEPTALDGLLVIDFTRVVAGPACTQTLADFGAEVIKIENPDGGDDTRAYEHAEIGGESAAYLSLNRNKRGIALDFNNPAALEVARELIAKADVVVENFSGGIMKKFGLDYASVSATNRLEVTMPAACRKSGSLRKSPDALWPVFTN